MHRMVAITNSVVMIGLLAGGAVLSGFVMLTPELRSAVTKPLPGYGYVDGRITAQVEGTYEEELPVRGPSVDLLNAFTLALFNEGRKGVVVGDEGWLFSAEEYEWTPQSPSNLESNLAHIAEVAAELAARGISLQVALLPEKADIYDGLLGRERPAVHEGKYEQVRRALGTAIGVEVTDLRAALRAASANDAMFVPTDTHWTVAGAGVVAEALAAGFPRRADIAASEFTLKPGERIEHRGDLLNFIELGPFAGMLPRTESTVTPVVAVAGSGGLAAFLAEDATTPEIALVGTSYSANPLWSFEALLKASLDRDIANFAEEGHGPLRPMDAFIEKLRTGEVSVKAVIWEIPIRYLDDAPDRPATPSSSV